MRNFRSSALAVTVVLALLALSAGAVRAQGDVYVIESSVPSIKVGTSFGAADKISVPAGGYLRAVLPSGKTHTIKGPYQGTVADLAGGQARNEGVIAWLRALMQTGGATEGTSGATRSMRRSNAPAIPVPFSWTAVPVTSDGDLCVQRGATLQLTRSSTARAEQVTVVDAVSKAQGHAAWAAGQDATPWPAAVPARHDGVYLLVIPDRARRQVKLHMLDRVPAEADILTTLQAQNCKAQFHTWVRERMTAKR